MENITRQKRTQIEMLDKWVLLLITHMDKWPTTHPTICTPAGRTPLTRLLRVAFWVAKLISNHHITYRHYRPPAWTLTWGDLQILTYPYLHPWVTFSWIYSYTWNSSHLEAYPTWLLGGMVGKIWCVLINNKTINDSSSAEGGRGRCMYTGNCVDIQSNPPLAAELERNLICYNVKI